MGAKLVLLSTDVVRQLNLKRIVCGIPWINIHLSTPFEVPPIGVIVAGAAFEKLTSIRLRPGSSTAALRSLHLSPRADSPCRLRGTRKRMGVAVEKLSLERPIPEEILPAADDVPFSVGHHRTIETLARQGRTVREIVSSVQAFGHRVLVGAPEQIANSIEACSADFSLTNATRVMLYSMARSYRVRPLMNVSFLPLPSALPS